MAEQLAVKVRAVTAEEAAFFKEKGWVKLDNLITTELAAEFLQRAKARMGSEGDAPDARERYGFVDYELIAEEDELFAALVFGKDLGQNAQRLIRALTGREVAVRSLYNSVLAKLPAVKTAKSRAAGPTDWHQDAGSPVDRVGILQFWIALDDVTPEMGSMRFFSGSHRLGKLGQPGRWPEGKGVLDVYPNLKDEFPMSPPLYYRPGDATVHAGQTVHGAPENRTGRSRWSYIAAYFPADTLYTGGEYESIAGLGLEVWKPFEHPTRFRVVYP